MKSRKTASIAMLATWLLVAASATVRAQAAQQSSDQSSSPSSTEKKTKKKQKASTDKPTSAPAASAAPASTPASKPATVQAPPASSAGTVWVNTDSGVYHKPGSRWYGKTKQGKYMTEADAKKAGYHEAKKNE